MLQNQVNLVVSWLVVELALMKNREFYIMEWGMAFILLQFVAMTLPLNGLMNRNECGVNMTPNTMQTTCQFIINIH